jgi:SAM-dependent methyltransferase
MQLKTLQKHWDCFGQTDPLFAILTHPERKDNKWDVDEFFRTGEWWVNELITEIQSLGLMPRGRCLDFGCGVGRLTQALCNYFETCDGVDIAPSMIELARKYNRHGERCRYHLNNAPDLRRFPDGSFSFVASFIVLQHIEPRYARKYIAEFIRVLAPGGVAAFHVPASCLAAAMRPRLPDSAYRARITLPVRHLMLQPHERITLNVEVENQSELLWPKYPLDGNDFARLKIGNHWRGISGRMVQLDDGRAHLPELRPHQTAIVPLTVTTPPRPGLYRLEVDIVEEGVTWFAQQGVATPRIWAMNRPRRLQPQVPQSVATFRPFSPVMEMHCIPKQDIFETVAATGGRVIQCTRDGYSGERYESYHYIVARVLPA